MDNEAVVRTLIQYLNESEEPELCWPGYWFEEVCFSRWAAGELIEAILDHPLAPAVEMIDEFAVKMTVYAAVSDGTDAGRIFSIAAKFAYETLESLFGEEYVNA